ncbi:heterokaryon incompatibility protein-domain-containing protein [Fusarium redolens]|uniref:Heterokaryon incompatibility protein-domain-containing protein n=1 Tax=Fusarium redolens TaxID=48865 RepID=A0A9P9HBN0_FUSRE|nr:heterokaryon incompatibility protein-domain-containing protein [Fusarium redolens]KAH7254330.1 heterokaryon incompatibility protein-domain-containing protein [Fusarium redolens]
MATAHRPQQLCAPRSTLTFVMLRDGYTHPLAYRDTIISGKTCALCRLMICSTGKLLVNLDSYKMHNQYDSLTPRLPELSAVSREESTISGQSPLIEKLKQLAELNWSTSQYISDLKNSWEVRKGNFNDRETIQITAPADSLYGAHGFVPLTDIEPASSKRNYRVLRKWLSTCMASHEGCHLSHSMTDESAEETTVLPTRVIDVGDVKEHRAKPRLFVSNKASGQYIALSHRWSKEVATKLKSDNLSRYQKELPVNDMPPTFQDAIEVTRQLGFRYLWIDSLCIIQDDESDWSHESHRMGTIFEEAVCTIAAVDSVDDNGIDHGLFLPRDTDPLSVKLTIPYKKVPLSKLSQRAFKTHTSVYVWKKQWLREIPTIKTCDKNTITIRPRIVSSYERLLSRRLIYYTKNKLSWSCFTESGEEEGGDPKQAARTPLLPLWRRSYYPIFRTWEPIISDYQRCQLTFSKDRLAAVGGISARLEAHFSCKIYAGIVFQSPCDAAENLLWYASKAPLRTFNEFHAPSWTWVAFNGETSFFMPTPPGTSDLLISRLDFKTRNQSESTDPSKDCKGTCVSGSVSFEGPAEKLTRQCKLKDLKIAGGPIDPISEREILAGILGRALVPNIVIPRFGELGKEVRMPYNPPVPDHTEILEDKCGCIVGFFIPDLEEELEQATGEQQIICVGVKRYQDQYREFNSRDRGCMFQPRSKDFKSEFMGRGA